MGLTDIGGVNSLRSFTRSWARAASFPEVIPQRPAFVLAPDQEPSAKGPRPEFGRDEEETPVQLAIQYERHPSYRLPISPAGPRTSLLRQQHLEAATSSSAAAGGGTAEDRHQQQQQADLRERESKPLDSDLARAFYFPYGGSPGRSSGSIFSVPPHLATPDLVRSYTSLPPSVGEYGYGYGTLATPQDQRRRPSGVSSPGLGPSDVPGSGARTPLLGEPLEPVTSVGGLGLAGEVGAELPDSELQPILVKEVEQSDGRIVLAVKGQSTLPQTVFNSTNVLIGVGLLSLPLGMRYAGWICGMIVLAAAAIVTSYTARILARCQDLDPSLITFSDIAYVSFGRKARVATSVLFTLELLAANVALMVLFADSLALLFPDQLTVTEWKVVCAVVLIPLNFLPLSLLSYTSFVGILSCLSSKCCVVCREPVWRAKADHCPPVIAIIFIDGLLKPHAPGSLIEPAKTYLFPANWLTLPLSFGLLMSPWGGHSVFPNIYRDMRHPYKYRRAVKITFTITYLMDLSTAAAGLLMFGDDARDEITSNILAVASYPRVLTFLLCVFVAVIPLTKIPLNTRPIVTMIEVIFGIHHHIVVDGSGTTTTGPSCTGLLRLIIRAATIFVFLAISILIPEFESIMAFMGSALCFTICVT